MAQSVSGNPLRAFAERYTEAWCSQQPSAVAAFFAPHGSLTVNDGAPAVGRDAITELAQSFMTTFPDLKVMMDELWIGPDGAEYHWTLTGTSQRRAVRISGVEKWTIGSDGLIAASRGYFDADEYRKQLGE